jgi:HEAT repeat protein
VSSLTEFVEKLDCADEAERTYAAEDIGYLNIPEGVDVLLDRLRREPSRAVRDAIFQALTRIEAAVAIEGLVGLLGSDNPEIRNQAVDVLRHKGARSIPFLSAVMRDGDKDLRKLVLDVLTGVDAGTGTTGASEIYTAALCDEDPNVVITAVENLGKLRVAGFRTRIEELLLADSHPMLTGACLEALAAMGDELSATAIGKRFPDLSAVPDFLLASCLKALGAVGEAGAFAEVARLLPARGRHLRPAILGALIAIHQRDPVIPSGEGFLTALEAIIEDGDPPLSRYQAVRALGYLSSRDDVYAFLVSCLSSPERLVRLGATESLRLTQRPGTEEVLFLRSLKETDEEVLQALIC